MPKTHLHGLPGRALPALLVLCALWTCSDGSAAGPEDTFPEPSSTVPAAQGATVTLAPGETQVIGFQFPQTGRGNLFVAAADQPANASGLSFQFRILLPNDRILTATQTNPTTTLRPLPAVLWEAGRAVVEITADAENPETVGLVLVPESHADNVLRVGDPRLVVASREDGPVVLKILPDGGDYVLTFEPYNFRRSNTPPELSLTAWPGERDLSLAPTERGEELYWRMADPGAVDSVVVRIPDVAFDRYGELALLAVDHSPESVAPELPANLTVVEGIDGRWDRDEFIIPVAAGSPRTLYLRRRSAETAAIRGAVVIRDYPLPCIHLAGPEEPLWQGGNVLPDDPLTYCGPGLPDGSISFAAEGEDGGELEIRLVRPTDALEWSTSGTPLTTDTLFEVWDAERDRDVFQGPDPATQEVRPILHFVTEGAPPESFPPRLTVFPIGGTEWAVGGQATPLTPYTLTVEPVDVQPELGEDLFPETSSERREPLPPGDVDEFLVEVGAGDRVLANSEGPPNTEPLIQIWSGDGTIWAEERGEVVLPAEPGTYRVRYTGIGVATGETTEIILRRERP